MGMTLTSAIVIDGEDTLSPKWQGYGLLFNFTLLGLLTLTKLGEGEKLVPRLDPI